MPDLFHSHLVKDWNNARLDYRDARKRHKGQRLAWKKLCKATTKLLQNEVDGRAA